MKYVNKCDDYVQEIRCKCGLSGLKCLKYIDLCIKLPKLLYSLFYFCI
jgi:hypothetical protein